MGGQSKLGVRKLVVGLLAGSVLAASSAAAEELSLPDRLVWAKPLLERERSWSGHDGSDLIRLAIECEGRPQPILVSVKKGDREARPAGFEIRRGGGGGVNTEYEVRSPGGCRSRCLTSDTDAFGWKRVFYVHPDGTRELVWEGTLEDWLHLPEDP